MDVIHGNRFRSIYDRTDYITNLNPAYQSALAETWRYGIATEINRRTGFPVVDLRPQFNPITTWKRPTLSNKAR